MFEFSKFHSSSILKQNNNFREWNDSIKMCDVQELSIDEDLSVYVNIPDFVDLDSDNETDYSADEAENPVNIDEDYIFKKEEVIFLNLLATFY